ncbi:hypothetical protein K8T06_10280 [bacterium]|nr:hypothetical protein [bacterium]
MKYLIWFTQPVPIYWIIIGIAGISFCLYFFISLVIRKKLESKFRKRSHAVMTGLVNEQMAPLIEGFPGTPSDARFLGKPIDYIVFDGLTQGDVKEILFVEVKSHINGRLTSNERSVREAVKNKCVRWVVYSPK